MFVRRTPVDTEKGAALPEFALVLPLLLVVLFGIVEIGMAFKDYLSVSHATTEGARAGVSAADDVQADFVVLETVKDSMVASIMSEIDWIRIGDPDAALQYTEYQYTPGAFGGDCDWTPCPNFFAGTNPGDPPYTPPVYLPSSRDVSAPTLGRLEVQIRYQHQWVTAFIADVSIWETDKIMRIEPTQFD